jgi:hypothetical protein
VRTEWLRERGGDRRMMVLEPVTFVRAGGEVITVEPGFIFDGASIPRPLWALVGSPFTGDYRDGAVIHDWLCKQRAQSGYYSATAHRILYECAMALQCNPNLAWAVWTGVRIGGPRWSL